MNVSFDNNISFKVFDLELAPQLLVQATRTGQAVYTLKTEGRSNWLERGIHIVDELGLVLLPANSPDMIDLPDDYQDDSSQSLFKRLA